ncbi:Lysozyme [Lamellibrachia satsuma]|nr:Lysozyme [Lamellibrachia satsuma]
MLVYMPVATTYDNEASVHRDKEDEVFNANCWCISLLDNIREKCQCPNDMEVELSDEHGHVKHLSELPYRYASELLQERERLVLLRVERGDEDDLPKYVPLLKDQEYITDAFIAHLSSASSSRDWVGNDSRRSATKVGKQSGLDSSRLKTPTNSSGDGETGVLKIITSNCLKCICEIEGCDSQIGLCRMDLGSLSCGPYQLKDVYWTDCGKPGSDYQSCTKQKACSEKCMKGYMDRYGESCTGKSKLTCLEFGRIHNGGPNGCKATWTVGYSQKVTKCCQKAGGC